MAKLKNQIIAIAESMLMQKTGILEGVRKIVPLLRNFQAMHDDILMYSAKASNPTRAFKTQYEPPSESYTKRFQGKTQILDEETGTRKITVDEATKGMPLRDVWDISIIAFWLPELFRTAERVKPHCDPIRT